MHIPFFSKKSNNNANDSKIIFAPTHLTKEEKKYVHDKTSFALKNIYKNKKIHKYIMDYTSFTKFSDGANLYVLEELPNTEYKRLDRQLFFYHFLKMYKNGEITIFVFGINYNHQLNISYIKNTNLYNSDENKYYSCNLFQVNAPIEKLHDTMGSIHEALFEFVDKNRKK